MRGKGMLTLRVGFCLITVLFTTIFLASCGKKASDSKMAEISGDLWEESADRVSEGDPKGEYILMGINKKESLIRFYNVELSRVQSFEYSGYSVYHDA